MCAIYGNMDPINIHPMLVYIPYMDPMGNSQWRSWKPLNVQEKCFFFHTCWNSVLVFTQTQKLTSSAFHRVGQIWKGDSPAKWIRIEGNSTGTFPKRKHHLLGWLTTSTVFFADFSIFHPPNTRNTRSAMAAHVHCWLDRMVPQCTQARNSAYAPGRVHKTIGSPAINRSKIYGDDS